MVVTMSPLIKDLLQLVMSQVMSGDDPYKLERQHSKCGGTHRGYGSATGGRCIRIYNPILKDAESLIHTNCFSGRIFLQEFKI